MAKNKSYFDIVSHFLKNDDPYIPKYEKYIIKNKQLSFDFDLTSQRKVKQKSNPNVKIEQINELKVSNKDPRVIISKKAGRKMDYIIDTVPTEVGWLGTVNKTIEDGGEVYTITDVFVPEQLVAAATCEIKSPGRSQLAMDLLKKYGDEEGEKIINSLQFWGHSHVNMGVSPSGQDDSMILEFKTRDFFIRGIFNKKGDIKMDIYDFKNNIKYLDVNPEFESDITDEEKSELDIAIKEKLKPITYQTTYNPTKASSFKSKAGNSGYYNPYKYSASDYWDTGYHYPFEPDEFYDTPESSSKKDTTFTTPEYRYEWNPILGRCEKVYLKNNNQVVDTKPLYPDTVKKDINIENISSEK